MKKLLRDLFVIGLLFGGFYLLAMSAELLSEEPPPARTDYSAARVRADNALEKRDYREAIPHLEKLVEKDPYNSYALERLAVCSARLRLELLEQGVSESSAELANYSSKAVDAFTRLLDFPRCANWSRYQLAVFSAEDGDSAQAIAFLRDALEDGFFSKRGIGDNRSFAALADDEEFRSLQALELKNRRAAERRRRSFR